MSTNSEEKDIKETPEMVEETVNQEPVEEVKEEKKEE